MRKLMLLASAAMLLMGQAALAQGKGQGQGKGGGGHAEEDRGGGQGKGGGHEGKGRGGDRGQQARQAPRADKPDRGRGRDDGVRVARDRGGDRGPRIERGRGNDRVVNVERVDDTRRVLVVDRDRSRRLVPALMPGCPPGLAKKNNGCLPPGQARKIYGDPLTSMFRYAPWYGAARDNDWRYMNGYAYRLDPASGLVNSFLPLLGGSLFPGSTWPTGYTNYAIDPYYPRFYGYDDDYDYRYVDGGLFAVDPRTQRIDSITALLAGDPWAVGQPMPLGYSAYNVPPPYRSRYYDSPTDLYRYSDGYVYRVDPTTQLVSAVISLLA